MNINFGHVNKLKWTIHKAVDASMPLAFKEIKVPDHQDHNKLKRNQVQNATQSGLNFRRAPYFIMHAVQCL